MRDILNVPKCSLRGSGKDTEKNKQYILVSNPGPSTQKPSTTDNHVCCTYGETGIITVVKSVARTRLVKTENPSVCVTMNCKLCRSGIALIL
jgi:hypothetical protein